MFTVLTRVKWNRQFPFNYTKIWKEIVAWLNMIFHELSFNIYLDQESASAQTMVAQATRDPEPPVFPPSSFRWTTRDRPMIERRPWRRIRASLSFTSQLAFSSHSTLPKNIHIIKYNFHVLRKKCFEIFFYQFVQLLAFCVRRFCHREEHWRDSSDLR